MMAAQRPALIITASETMAEQPAPAPRNILRGHKAQIHTAAFIRHNERLATADADGYVVLWDLAVMRPTAVWRAHENSVLGVQAWGPDKLITHGRDHKLVVWRLSLQDEQGMSTALPVEHVAAPRRQPWILHLLELNTLNFCSFAACARRGGETLSGPHAASDVLLAVPNTLASDAIDIYALPDQSRLHTVRSGATTGLVMSLRLLHLAGSLTLIAGFENGSASVRRLDSAGAWVTTYCSQPHSQPVLSLDVHPSHDCFFTSSADSIIAQHPIPTAQRLCSSPDASGTSQATAETGTPSGGGGGGGVGSLFPNASKATGSPGASRPAGRLEEWKHPLKTVNTKHSGQQSLRVRDDGKIFATAGWDSKVRVYSSKTLNELAVLHWHKVGAYAVAFADVAQPSADAVGQSSTEQAAQPLNMESSSENATTSLVSGNGLFGAASMSVKARRIRQARTAHWIAAGAKDGKVSLWDIY